jgi:hypothetical protein
LVHSKDQFLQIGQHVGGSQFFAWFFPLIVNEINDLTNQTSYITAERLRLWIVALVASLPETSSMLHLIITSYRSYVLLKPTLPAQKGHKKIEADYIVSAAVVLCRD